MEGLGWDEMMKHTSFVVFTVVAMESAKSFLVDTLLPGENRMAPCKNDKLEY